MGGLMRERGKWRGGTGGEMPEGCIKMGQRGSATVAELEDVGCAAGCGERGEDGHTKKRPDKGEEEEWDSHG